MKKKCNSCFDEYDSEYDICPHCGYNELDEQEQTLALPIGNVLYKRYCLGMMLWQDDFEILYFAWDSILCKKVVVKEYFPTEFSTRILGEKNLTVFTGEKSEQYMAGYKKFLEESRCLVEFQKMDGIVGILDSFEENNTVYLVQDYIESKTLEEVLATGKKYSPKEAVALLADIMDTLSLINKEKIIHKDIAPENICIDEEGHARLTNFGASRFATTVHSRSLSILINKGYSPEELYRSRDDKGSYTDVYEIAAVLYRMITGQVPPDAMERRAMLEMKGKDLLQPIRKYLPDIDKNFENAILNAMNVKIEDRTPDLACFLHELQSGETVVRKKNSIRKKDIFHWPLWAKVCALAGGCTAVVFAVLFFTGIIGNFSHLQKDILIDKNQTRVPSVVNMELTKAEKKVESANLLYGIVDKKYSSQIKKDMVLSQDVEGGLVVDKNTMVGIIVSAGMQQVLMPDLIGLNQKTAVSLLKEQGFMIKIKKEYSHNISKGCITSQTPKENEGADKGCEVTLVVSKGMDPETIKNIGKVEVPGFVGHSFESALYKSEQSKLLLRVVKKIYSSKYGKEEVISQNIPEGTKVDAGTTIEIVVSLGLEQSLVPDVTYMHIDRAQSLMKKNGLTVQITYKEDDTIMEDVVISQSKRAGAVVNKGSVIALVVSKGRASVQVPNVIGMSEEEAINTLNNKMFIVEVQYRSGDDSNSGKVIAQSISSGQSADYGEQVVITVATGEKLQKSISVMGMSEDAAVQKLVDAGFNVEVNKIYSVKTVGSVIGQNPSGGSMLRTGSNIVLTVSKGIERVVVPGVVGESSGAATQALKNKGFSVSIEKQYSSTAKGVVIHQYPESGKKVEKGSNVQIVVSLGVKTISVNQISISNSKLVLVEGEVASLSAKVYPSNATNKDIMWYSSNKGVVTVSESGTVKAVAEGKAVITVSSVDGRHQASCTILVQQKRKAVGIEIKDLPYKMVYQIGETISTDGLKLDLLYNDGSAERITDGYNALADFSTEGIHSVTIEYGGFRTQYKVEVKPAPTDKPEADSTESLGQ